MMSFFQTRFFQVDKQNFKATNMNALAAMFFLLLFLAATFAHASHLTGQTTNTNSSECYLCNQGLDTPSTLSQVKLLTIVSYFLVPNQAVTSYFKDSDFVQPQLRAPPVFP